MSNSVSHPVSVARILYKEVVEGDLRKIAAESNDSDTGGGARDFRFGDFQRLEPIVRKMFPDVIKDWRRRGNQTIQVDILVGMFHWYSDDGAVLKRKVEFEPPTTARPNEGRITKVHEQPSFDVRRIPELGEGNRVLLLLVQRADGTLWPHFVTEKSLEIAGAWDPRVANELLACIRARRPAGRAVIGYRDFGTGDMYCNGK